MIFVVGIIVIGCGDRADKTGSMVDSSERARHANAEELIRLHVYALEIYRLHTGEYPETEPGLVRLREQPTEEKDRDVWRGPYLPKEIPLNDPWGRLLVYQRNPDASAYTLLSLGPDPQNDADDLSAQKLMPRLFEEMSRYDDSQQAIAH